MTQTAATVRFASAISDAQDTGAALGQVCDQLRQQVAAPVDLAVAMATAHHRDGFALIQERLRQTLAPRVMMGVTGEGVIGVGREIEDGPGLSVLAASMPGAVIEPFSYDQIDWQALADQPSLIHEALNLGDHPTRAVILLVDPFSTAIGRVLSVLGQSLPGTPIVGGVASGAAKEGGNRLLLNDRIGRAGAVGVVIGGEVQVSTLVSQGCRPVGKPMVITRAQRNLVQELGGHGAVAAVQDLLTGLSEPQRELVRTQGLLVGRVIDEYKARFGRGDFLIRGIMGLDPERGYIAVGDPSLRVGQTIQFHLRDRQTAEEDLALLLETQKLHGPAAGALLFSCNGRGKRLFEAPDHDARAVESALGAVPLAGFFAAGEIGPVGCQNFIHGHTASMAVFRPMDEAPE